jgi:hypothetical protein
VSVSGDEETFESDICSSGDADAMARLLGEVFSRRDPPAVAVGLTASEFETFARPYCPKAAVEGLTCLEHGARRGYRLAVTEATNTTSQHLFRKLGFTERVRQSYLHHRFAGQAVFTSIAEQGGPALMERSLVA